MYFDIKYFNIKREKEREDCKRIFLYKLTLLMKRRKSKDYFITPHAISQLSHY